MSDSKGVSIKHDEYRAVRRAIGGGPGASRSHSSHSSTSHGRDEDHARLVGLTGSSPLSVTHAASSAADGWLSVARPTTVSHGRAPITTPVMLQGQPHGAPPTPHPHTPPVLSCLKKHLKSAETAAADTISLYHFPFHNMAPCQSRIRRAMQARTVK